MATVKEIQRLVHQMKAASPLESAALARKIETKVNELMLARAKKASDQGFDPRTQRGGLEEGRQAVRQ